VFTASRICPDGTGFHVRRAIKSGFDTVFAGLDKHLRSCITDGYRFDVDLLFFGDVYFFSHLLPPFGLIEII
jgi:hypothetical protein